MKVVADSHIPFIQDYFANCDLVLKPGRHITQADLQDADILFVRSITRIDEHLLNNTKIKFVGSVTTGIDHLDTEYLDKKGILWSAAFGFNAPPVADYVVSVIAALQKLPTPKLHHKKTKAAVIGVGNVGKLVTEHLLALNFDVIVCDPIRAEHEPDFVSTPLEELSHVDLISLHVPLTKTGRFPTYHCINAEFLKRQQPGCVLLNTSRGSVINSEDLLLYGQHLTWCFDVFEHEPHINKAILEKTLVATPHIAGYSIQSKIRGIDMVYRIACEKGIIHAQNSPAINRPNHNLPQNKSLQDWQDIILTIFNPLELTRTMRTSLLTTNEHGHLFDDMRNAFNYRHEFAYCTLPTSQQLSSENKNYLRHLGIKVT